MRDRQRSGPAHVRLGISRGAIVRETPVRRSCREGERAAFDGAARSRYAPTAATADAASGLTASPSPTSRREDVTP